MVKKVDSDALGILNKALGLTGAGSPVTELADGVVDQTLDVAPIVRRSRTQAATEGIYTGIFRNVHPGSGTLTATIEPYDLVLGGVRRPPYPAPMPAQFDVWILSATLSRISGSGTIAAGIFLNYPVATLAFGIEDDGSAVTDTPLTPLTLWNTFINVGTNVGVFSGVSGPYDFIRTRIPRVAGIEIRFVSVASALATWQAQIVLGVFPVALGQDGIV